MSTTPKAGSQSPTLPGAIETLLNFVKHPGTSTSLGLVLAGLSQFTAAVPVKDLTAPTILGLGYAVAAQVIDWLKSATK